MWTRRDLLRIGGAVGTAALLPKTFKSTEDVAAASAAVADRTPEDVAQDEFYWREIQEAFTLDRTLTNLNNGNSCPSPREGQERVSRNWDRASMLRRQYTNMSGANTGPVGRGLPAELGSDGP